MDQLIDPQLIFSSTFDTNFDFSFDFFAPLILFSFWSFESILMVQSFPHTIHNPLSAMNSRPILKAATASKTQLFHNNNSSIFLYWPSYSLAEEVMFDRSICSLLSRVVPWRINHLGLCNWKEKKTIIGNNEDGRPTWSYCVVSSNLLRNEIKCVATWKIKWSTNGWYVYVYCMSSQSRV